MVVSSDCLNTDLKQNSLKEKRVDCKTLGEQSFCSISRAYLSLHAFDRRSLFGHNCLLNHLLLFGVSCHRADLFLDNFLDCVKFFLLLNM